MRQQQRCSIAHTSREHLKAMPSVPHALSALSSELCVASAAASGSAASGSYSEWRCSGKHAEKGDAIRRVQQGGCSTHCH